MVFAGGFCFVHMLIIALVLKSSLRVTTNAKPMKWAMVSAPKTIILAMIINRTLDWTLLPLL